MGVSFYCDPKLHNGKKINAAYYIKRMDGEFPQDQLYPPSFACCSNHIHYAMDWLSGHKFEVQKVN